MEGVNAIFDFAYGVYSILGISLYVFIIMLISVVIGVSRSYQLDIFCKVYTKTSIILSILCIVIISIYNTIAFILG